MVRNFCFHQRKIFIDKVVQTDNNHFLCRENINRSIVLAQVIRNNQIYFSAFKLSGIAIYKNQKFNSIR